jgi:squalene synthase HpnC
VDLRSAYRHCHQVAFGHYENFPVASALLPQPQRDAIAAVYAYARTADDFADEPAYAARRMGLLRDWKRRLDREPGEDPIFTALQDACRRWRLPKPLLRDLVDAFLQDCRQARYADFRQVLGYCRRSANPVGRLVLRIFGLDTAQNLADSDAICTALQLANHWQDLGHDVLIRDRIYLPQDEMRRHKVTVAQLKQGIFHAGTAALLRFQVDRSEAYFAQGAGLVDRMPGRLRLELRLTVLGGRAVLAKIRGLGYDTLGRRPKLGWMDGAGLLAKALLGRSA